MYGLNRGEVGSPGPNHRERAAGDSTDSADKFSSKFKTRLSGDGVGYSQEYQFDRDSFGSKRPWAERGSFPRDSVVPGAVSSRESSFPRKFHGRTFSEGDGGRNGARHQVLEAVDAAGDKPQYPYRGIGYNDVKVSSSTGRVDSRDERRQSRESLKGLGTTLDVLQRPVYSHSSLFDKKKDGLSTDPRNGLDHLPGTVLESRGERSQTLVSSLFSSKEGTLKSLKQPKAENSKILDVWESDNSRDSSSGPWRAFRSKSFGSGSDAVGGSDWAGELLKPMEPSTFSGSLVTSPRKNSDFLFPSEAGGSPPAKRTRLGWGQGLAKYEGKVGEVKENMLLQDVLTSGAGDGRRDEKTSSVSEMLEEVGGELLEGSAKEDFKGNGCEDVSSKKESILDVTQGKGSSDMGKLEPGADDVSESDGQGSCQDMKANGVHQSEPVSQAECPPSVPGISNPDSWLDDQVDVGSKSAEVLAGNELEDSIDLLAQNLQEAADLAEGLQVLPHASVDAGSREIQKDAESSEAVCPATAAPLPPSLDSAALDVSHSEQPVVETEGSEDNRNPTSSTESQPEEMDVQANGVRETEKESDEHMDILSMMEGVDSRIDFLKKQLDRLLALEEKLLAFLEKVWEKDKEEVSNMQKELEEVLGVSFKQVSNKEESEIPLAIHKVEPENKRNHIPARTEQAEAQKEDLSSREPEASSQIVRYCKPAPLSWFLSNTRQTVLEILLTNHRKAREATSALDTLTEAGSVLRHVCGSPVEILCWSLNEERHIFLFERLQCKMRDLRSVQVTVERSLALRYRALRDVWQNLPRSDERTSASKVVLKMGSGKGRNGFHPLHALVNLPGKSASVSIACRQEMVLKSLERFMAAPCKPALSMQMPSMVIGLQNLSSHSFDNSNSLVEDPRELERERKAICPWTDEEKEIFYDKFAEFGKGFASIACHLPHKTVGDCIEFYYRNQKKKDFRKPKKKQEAHRNGSYMATTRQRGARARQLNAVDALPPPREIPRGSRTPTQRSRDQARLFAGLSSASFTAPLLVRVSPRGREEKAAETAEEKGGGGWKAADNRGEASPTGKLGKGSPHERGKQEEESEKEEAERGEAEMEKDGASSESERDSAEEAEEKFLSRASNRLSEELLQPLSIRVAQSQLIPSDNGQIFAVLALPAGSAISAKKESPEVTQRVVLTPSGDAHVDFELPLILEEVIEGAEASQGDVAPAEHSCGGQQQADAMEEGGPEAAEEPPGTQEAEREASCEVEEAAVPEAERESDPSMQSRPREEQIFQFQSKEVSREELVGKLSVKIPGKLPRGRPPKDKSRGKKKRAGTSENGARTRPFEEGEFCLPESFRVGTSAAANESPSLGPGSGQRGSQKEPSFAPHLQEKLSAGQEVFAQNEFSAPKRTTMASLEQQVQRMIHWQRGNSLISSLQAKGALQGGAFSPFSQPLPIPSFQNTPLLHSPLLAQHASLAQLAKNLNWPLSAPQVFQEDSAGKKAAAEEEFLQGRLQRELKGDVKLFGQSLLSQTPQSSAQQQRRTSAPPEEPMEASKKDPGLMSIADSVEKWMAGNGGGGMSASVAVEDEELEMRQVMAGVLRRGNLDGTTFAASGQAWMDRMSAESSHSQQRSRAGEQKALELLRQHQLGELAAQGGGGRGPGRSSDRPGMELFGRGGTADGRLESLHNWRLGGGQSTQGFEEAQSSIMALALASIHRQRQQQQQQQQSLNSNGLGHLGGSSSTGDQLRRDAGASEGK